MLRRSLESAVKICIGCNLPTGRGPDARRCLPCWHKRNREKARAWYNAHPDRVAARARAWVDSHRERNRLYQREWNRKRRPQKVCESEGCTKIIEVGQRKFCRGCRDFYNRELWHTFKRVA